jgi:hypothetical protein
MSRIVNAQRVTSSCYTAVVANISCSTLPRRVLRRHHIHHPSLGLRPISTTTPLNLPLPVKKTASEEPKISQKKVSKEKKGPSASKLEKADSAEKRMLDIMIRAHDATPLELPPATSEEMERRYNIGRNYVIGCFKKHNELNHDLAVKIRMKRYAIKMLPREGIDLGDAATTTTTTTAVGGTTSGQSSRSMYGRWKEEALKINYNFGPPEHRHIPMYTPPIEGFDVNQYMNRDDEDN